MSKEYNDRWTKPLRDTYLKEDFVRELLGIVQRDEAAEQ